MASRRRVYIHVCGQVQGVGFRFFTQENARRFGLTGFVRNLPNGDVDAEAEGESEAVKAFVEALKKGPSAARVDRVRVDELALVREETSFEVRMF